MGSRETGYRGMVFSLRLAKRYLLVFLNPSEVGLQGQLMSHDQFVSNPGSLLRFSLGRILKGLHICVDLPGMHDVKVSGPGRCGMCCVVKSSPQLFEGWW